MKIALLSDIHGNADALRAALAQAKGFGAQEYYGLGDYVGYYYEPAECLRLLEDVNAIMLRGNHEDLLFESISSKERAEELRLKYGSGFLVAAEQLSEDQIEILRSLSGSKHILSDGTRIGMYHGAPFDNSSYLYPDAGQADLSKCANHELDIIFFGHGHYQFTFQADNTLVVNVGSVGQPRDVGKQATWVLCDTASRTVAVHRAPYNVKYLQDEAKKRDPHYKYLWEVLQRGYE